MTEKRYDSVLVGSDQLWLPGNIAADYYTLNWVPEGINTVAYATSFGQASLPRNISGSAEKFLKRIRHLSVREYSGQKLIMRLSGRRVPVVCDPTLLFDGQKWMSIQRKEPLYEGKYIFCYFLGKNRLHREYAKKLRIYTGYRIIALTHLDEYVKWDNGYADETPYDVDPAGFLNLIRNASYVCTDSFHCTAFSIQYGVPFTTFRRFGEKAKVSTNSRLDTLLRMTGATNRLIENAELIKVLKKPKKDLLAVLDNSDLCETEKSLEKVRMRSWKYLETAVRDI